MTLTQRDILRALRDLGGWRTSGDVTHHLGVTTQQTYHYPAARLLDAGCVEWRWSERKRPGRDGARYEWQITPLGVTWLEALDMLDRDSLPSYDISCAVSTWLLVNPGLHSTVEIMQANDITDMLSDRSRSDVRNILSRMVGTGWVVRGPRVTVPSGKAALTWGFAGTPLPESEPESKREPRPRRRHGPRDAPPGYWDDHWQEIENDIRRIMTGRRPMLQVTLKRELHIERHPAGLLRVAIERGLISVSWVRGQQYYTLVG